jgi:hypothetical protein
MMAGIQSSTIISTATAKAFLLPPFKTPLVSIRLFVLKFHPILLKNIGRNEV